MILFIQQVTEKINITVKQGHKREISPRFSFKKEVKTIRKSILFSLEKSKC